MKILYFFSSIISPIKVRNFKKMSIFIALIIFVLEFWILFLPSRAYIINHSDYTASIYDYTAALYNLKDTKPAQFNDFKATNTKIENGEISSNKSDIQYLTYIYTYNEKNVCVYFVFDPLDLLDVEIQKVKDEYNKLYPNEGAQETTINAIAMLAFKESLEEVKVEPYSYESLIKKYHSWSEEELINKINETPYYEFYGINGLISNTNYGYCFTKDALIRSIDGETSIFSYDYLSFDSSKYEDMPSLSKDLALQMVQVYNQTLINLQMLYCVIYCILFPIIAVLILYLFTRKHKLLDSILDYYKIAALTSIIPAVVSCIFAILIGPSARNIYIILFIIYTLIMVFKAATVIDKNGNNS